MEYDLRKAIELMKAGKEEGLNMLYTVAYKKVLFRAKQCTKTEMDAEDVAIITFAEAYRNIDKLQSPEAIMSWLYTIVYNQSCKMYRNERDKREFLLSEDTQGVFDMVESMDISTQPELSMDQKETAKIVRDIIEELPEAQKMVILAYHFDNCKLEEIAETMNCSVNTVKSRLNYARKNIKVKIEEKEKKEGYRLHAFTLPTLLYAIQLLSEKTTITAEAAQAIYAKSCAAVGLKAAPLAIGGAGTIGAASGSVTTATAATKTAVATKTAAATKTVAAATGKAGALKSLLIASAVTVGGVGTVGGVYMYQHSQPAVIEEQVEEEQSEEVQLEDGTGVTEDGLFEYDAQGDVVTLTAYIGQEEGVEIPLEVAGRDKIVLGKKLFQKTSVRAVYVTENVINLSYGPFDEVFRDANKLEQIKISGSLETIPADTFHGCTSLKLVILEEGLQAIGDNAFFHCVELENVDIPESVKRIGQNAFGSSHVMEITVANDCAVHELNTTGFPESVDLIVHRRGETNGYSSSDIDNLLSEDYSNHIYLREKDAPKDQGFHPQKISDREYLFPEEVLKSNFSDSLVSVDIDTVNFRDPVRVKEIYVGDYLMCGENGRDVGSGVVFYTGEWMGDITIKLTTEQLEEKDLPYSEKGIDFTRLIGEWTAPDGTKLWIATTDGYTEGATIEFIKEHDIGWSDVELIRNEGNTAIFEYRGGGFIEICVTDLENIRINYALDNWNDGIEYILTKPGYEYYSY